MILRTIVNRIPYIRRLKHEMNLLRQEVARLRHELHGAQAQVEVLRGQLVGQGMFPAGHYYSPIPSRDDIRAYLERRQHPGADLPDIRMNAAAQRAVLEALASYYADLDFPEQQTPGHRYYYDNVWFGYSDAILLYGFLRRYAPRRIIEVGSGFSSAVMLDTIDRHYAQPPELTFIEPYPDRLNTLLTPADRERVTLLEMPVQQVPLAYFGQLQAGDLLFIDSSHVVKSGSDLQFLLFEVLPCLQPGVFVHFHDVFYPFDYPDDWLTEGRYWNENYFLRAFLMGNEQWQILLFGSYVHHAFRDVVAERLPLSARSTGGSLYLQRVA